MYSSKFIISSFQRDDKVIKFLLPLINLKICFAFIDLL